MAEILVSDFCANRPPLRQQRRPNALALPRWGTHFGRPLCEKWKRPIPC